MKRLLVSVLFVVALCNPALAQTVVSLTPRTVSGEMHVATWRMPDGSVALVTLTDEEHRNRNYFARPPHRDAELLHVFGGIPTLRNSTPMRQIGDIYEIPDEPGTVEITIGPGLVDFVTVRTLEREEIPDTGEGEQLRRVREKIVHTGNVLTLETDQYTGSLERLTLTDDIPGINIVSGVLTIQPRQRYDRTEYEETRSFHHSVSFFDDISGYTAGE